MPETTPLIKAALNLRVGAGFDVYIQPLRTVNEFETHTFFLLFLLPGVRLRLC